MIHWQKSSTLSVPQKVFKHPKEEPFDLYRTRYRGPSSPLRIKDAERYIKEVLGGLSGSLLVVGSGHADHCNTFNKHCPTLNITASDYVYEAERGLDPSISFICSDLLSSSIKENTFDYVFSAHTLEHFYKDALFNIVWPTLIKIASKAVITVVPYAEAWADEVTHKCKFFEDDEFAALQDKYKIIFNNQEILFWKSIV